MDRFRCKGALGKSRAGEFEPRPAPQSNTHGATIAHPDLQARPTQAGQRARCVICYELGSALRGRGCALLAVRVQ
jgi:hypothetical protein